VKQTGERSAGNLHAAFDEAGAGNVARSDGVTLADERARQRGTQTSTYTGAPVLDPTCERPEVKFLRPTHPYIPMARGFVYLAVVLDWFSRRVLSWRLSITMEAAFCVETLDDALARHGKPDIFNTDQGSQFTGSAFTGVLADNDIAISMDGKGGLAGQRLRRAVVAQRQI
jgi:transposase InsO family protein